MHAVSSEPRALLGGRRFFALNRPVIVAEGLGDTVELECAAYAMGYRLGPRLQEAGSSPLLELLPD